MKIRWVCRLAALLVLSSLMAISVLAQQRQTAPSPPAPFLPGLWWRDYQKNLGLTPEQTNRLEDVWQGWRGWALQKRDELLAQEAELSRLIQVDADDAAIGKQADRVEAIRSGLNKSRTLMLVHMRAVLTTEQRARLTTLREQWEREHPLPQRSNTSK
jgi:Spy/CpxP family protein refolding chaperone